MQPYTFHPAYFQVVFDTHGFDGPWPDRFAIITAWATTGETWTAQKSIQANAALNWELIARGVWHTRCTGLSPDGQHAEPGWAVAIDRDSACKLGHRFHQDAVFLVNSDRLEVCRCSPPGEVADAGSFASRILPT